MGLLPTCYVAASAGDLAWSPGRCCCFSTVLSCCVLAVYKGCVPFTKCWVCGSGLICLYPLVLIIGWLERTCSCHRCPSYKLFNCLTTVSCSLLSLKPFGMFIVADALCSSSGKCDPTDFRRPHAAPKLQPVCPPNIEIWQAGKNNFKSPILRYHGHIWPQINLQLFKSYLHMASYLQILPSLDAGIFRFKLSISIWNCNGVEQLPSNQSWNGCEDLVYIKT